MPKMSVVRRYEMYFARRFCGQKRGVGSGNFSRMIRERGLINDVVQPQKVTAGGGAQRTYRTVSKVMVGVCQATVSNVAR